MLSLASWMICLGMEPFEYRSEFFFLDFVKKRLRTCTKLILFFE